MRIGDWSSDVCSADLTARAQGGIASRRTRKESIHGIAGSVGAGDGASLYAAQSPELCDRSGALPAWVLHHEANPRLNEKVARFPGFADIHPLQPVATVQGALQLFVNWRSGCRRLMAWVLSPLARKPARMGTHMGYLLLTPPR